METQRDKLSLKRWPLLLLLLSLARPPATSAQTFSYQEAVLRAVDGFNQRSTEANLYRFLELDPQLQQDKDTNAPRPVSFRVKETVCPRTTRKLAEQCDFKENGLVKQCVGTVTLDRVNGYFDINCGEIQGAGLRGLGRLIGKGIEGLGRRIKGVFTSLEPREES